MFFALLRRNLLKSQLHPQPTKPPRLRPRFHRVHSAYGTAFSISIPLQLHPTPIMRIARHSAGTLSLPHLHQLCPRPHSLYPRYFSASCPRSSHYQTLGIPKTATRNQIKVRHLLHITSLLLIVCRLVTIRCPHPHPCSFTMC